VSIGHNAVGKRAVGEAWRLHLTEIAAVQMAPASTVQALATVFPPVELFDPVLDFGLEVLNQFANAIHICSNRPTTYAEAVAMSIGAKTFAAGGAFDAPVASSPNGEQITSTVFFDGTTTAGGVVACWAAVDSVNSELLAVGSLTGGVLVEPGNPFAISPFTIRSPAV
jgi:hypothetical protein